MLESVVEDLAVKKELFTRLDDIVKPEGILATNTSTLPVVELAMATERPDAGRRHPLLQPGADDEPRRGHRAADAPATTTVAAAKAFATGCGKDVVEVKDRAGFIVNALLFPYLNNAVRMLEAGTASRDDIDTAMKGGCNFPMGPLALLDLVGLDTSLSILDALYEEFQRPELRRHAAAAPHGRRRPARPEVRRRLLRLPEVAAEPSASQCAMSASELFDIAGSGPSSPGVAAASAR